MNNHNIVNQKKQDLSIIERAEMKKIFSSITSEFLGKHVSESAYYNAVHCGDFLDFLEDEERHRRKLKTGFFCKQRLCPMCSWRKSVKDAVMINAIVEQAMKQRYIPLFVTLTLKSVGKKDLKEAISKLYKGYKTLMRPKRYQCIKGAIRKLEITYNQERDCEKFDFTAYHPHLHLLWFVQPVYFKHDAYISQKKLLEDWRQALQDETIVGVSIQRLKKTKDSDGVLEIAKYSVKSVDYIQSQDVFNVFYESMKYARLLTFSGICSDLKKEYDVGNLNEWVTTDSTKFCYLVTYRWAKRNYQEDKIKRLDAPVDGSSLEPEVDV